MPKLSAPSAKAPPFHTLPDWLAWQEQLHPENIELGLARIADVAEKLHLPKPAPVVITIAGTNGKGSSAALLEQTLLSAGHTVAVYSSPHLLRYTERLRINGTELAEQNWCESFAAVEAARAGLSLTYFEFGTLAALQLIVSSAVDVAILEVGLGGRLDAVNIIDPDIALITSIGLDHQDWLGSDKEQIAREKAGIMRRGQSVVCSDPQPPASIAIEAKRIASNLYQAGEHFQYATLAEGWMWQGLGQELLLPRPALPGRHFIDNAAGVIAVLMLLREHLHWDEKDLAKALVEWSLPGRCEWHDTGRFGLLLDVAHNTEAAVQLAALLEERQCAGRRVALFAALTGKPVQLMLGVMSAVIDEWNFTGLPAPRGYGAEALCLEAERAGVIGHAYSDVAEAWSGIVSELSDEDELIVFGSFHTVEAVMRVLEKETG